MRHLRRNVQNVAGAEKGFRSAFDGRPANLSGCCGLAVHDFAAVNHGHRSSLNHNDVGLLLMPFGLSRAFPVGHHERSIAGGLHYFAGDFIGVKLRCQFLPLGRNVAGLPDMETSGVSCRKCENGCNEEYCDDLGHSWIYRPSAYRSRRRRTLIQLHWLMRFFAVCLICLSQLASAQTSAKPANSFFKDTFEQMLRDNPEYATGVGRHEFDDRWTDWSKAGRDRRKAFFGERLARLTAEPVGDRAEDLLTKRVVRYDFEARLEAWDLDTLLLRVGQQSGFHVRVYNVIDGMPAATVHDYENIIARIRAIPSYLDQNLGILDEAIAAKVMQPKVVVDLVIAQLDAQLNQSAEQTELLKAFRSFPTGVSQADQLRLRSAAQDTYTRQFLPAWRKARDYMANTYLPRVRPADSLSSMPGGKAAYATLIHEFTTTTMSPADIHKLGEQEVVRIEAAMVAIMKDSGFQGSIPEFQKKMDDDPAQHFKSKEEMLTNSRNIAMIIEPELPRQFRHIPSLLFGVRPIPSDREAATATNAQGAAADLSKPGWFNLNTYQPEKQVRYDQESLVLHEAIPGHIFQGAVATQQQGLPELRRFYSNSAFGEGWALYAESLGSQLGLYKDPYSRFGQLASERFRAVRLVVDTGIHDLGWTRQQAIDYFKTHSPQNSLAEVDRYISWPGQALSYKMGELRIRSLRAQAERELGSKFDIRDFNDAVIGEGRLPLDILSDEIGRFISKAPR